MVNIDALLSEWAYRCEKGYPNMDSPSDLRVLKTILKEQGIQLPEQQLSLFSDEELNAFSDTHEFDCQDIDEKEMYAFYKKMFPQYNEEQLRDLIQDAINSQCKKPLRKALSDKKWVFDKKGNIDHQLLDRYENEILLLTKGVSQEDRKKWIYYLNRPEIHIKFEPTRGAIGNLFSDLKASELPNTIISNIMFHTGKDQGGRGIGAGEFGMSLVFSNITAATGKGDLDLNGNEFEIKGQNATLGKRPDELNVINLDKFADYIDEIDDELGGEDNVDIKNVEVSDEEYNKLIYGKFERDKLTKGKPDPKKGKKTVSLIVYKNKDYQPKDFALILSDIYNNTLNKEDFKDAFKDTILELETVAKEKHAEAVEEFFDEIDFSTASGVQNGIALLNFYRYLLKEEFGYFLAHDIGADGKGKGDYIYAEGDPMSMTKELLAAGATFQPIAPNNMRPRIGFGKGFTE